jgi:hypothetical protein
MRGGVGGTHVRRADPVLGEREQVGAPALPRARRRRAHEVDPQPDALCAVLADQRVQLLAAEHVAAGEPPPHRARRARHRCRLSAPGAQPQRAPRRARSERERPEVGARDEVDRHAHQRRLDHAAVLQRAGQGRALEAGEPRPQPDVHRRRVLGLDAADRFQRARQRHPRSLEQELAGEQRAVELSPRERLHARQCARSGAQSRAATASSGWSANTPSTPRA